MTSCQPKYRFIKAKLSLSWELQPPIKQEYTQFLGEVVRAERMLRGSQNPGGMKLSASWGWERTETEEATLRVKLRTDA